MAKRRLGMLISSIDENWQRIMPQFDDNCQRIMRGVVRYVREHGGWEIATHDAVPSIPWDDLRRFRGDGLVAMVFVPQHYRRLRQKQMPCVNVCARCKTPGLPSVYSDNRRIGRLAAEFLWNTGLRRFAFVGRKNLYHDRHRGEGFQTLLDERGADCDSIVLEPMTDHPLDVADSAQIAERLRELPRPIGIYAAHDHLGCQVLSACRTLGIRVPYDAAVLGVNDFALLCEIAEPPLSSIRQQAERTGYEAARLLTRIVEGKADPNTQIRLPPGEVVERRSTDMLAVDDPDVGEALRFIRDRLEEARTVDDIVGHVSVSRRTLDKRFLATIGHTPADELRLTRIRRAKQLLSQTNLAVTEVALRCGFGTASSLDRAFRDATGMTPREHRREEGAQR